MTSRDHVFEVNSESNTPATRLDMLGCMLLEF